MKLLFDANLSYKLAQRLADLFPESEHVSSLGLQSAGDQEVWNYAARHDFVIVSKDEDFHQMSFLYGSPPKVVWLRLGNSTTADIEKAIRAGVDQIEAFAADEDTAFLVIGSATT